MTIIETKIATAVEKEALCQEVNLGYSIIKI